MFITTLCLPLHHHSLITTSSELNAYQVTYSRVTTDRQQTDRRLAGDWQATGRRLVGGRQAAGRRLAGDWQATGRRLAGDWQATGRRLAGDWQATGRRLAGDWQATGRRLAGDWQATGRRLAAESDSDSDSDPSFSPAFRLRPSDSDPPTPTLRLRPSDPPTPTLRLRPSDLPTPTSRPSDSDPPTLRLRPSDHLFCSVLVRSGPFGSQSHGTQHGPSPSFLPHGRWECRTGVLEALVEHLDHILLPSAMRTRLPHPPTNRTRAMVTATVAGTPRGPRERAATAGEPMARGPCTAPPDRIPGGIPGGSAGSPALVSRVCTAGWACLAPLSGEIALRSPQKEAGLARHKRQLASAGETTLPWDPRGLPAPPPSSKVSGWRTGGWRRGLSVGETKADADRTPGPAARWMAKEQTWTGRGQGRFSP
eukprot:gene10424-biopygen15329